MFRSVETPAGRIAVSDAGDGPLTLLMLHGNSAGRGVFGRQIRHFSPMFRTIAMDFAGHGDSDDARSPERDYTLAGQAGTIAHVLDALGVGPLVVLGVSLGGHIALEMTAMPLDIRGLVLVGSPPFAKSVDEIGRAFKPGPGLRFSGAESLDAAEIEQFIDLIGPGTASDRNVYRAALERTDGRARTTVVGALLADEARDQRALAEGFDRPIALINGADDPMVELEFAERLSYRRLWRGKGHRIAGAIHAPHTSHPAQFNDLVAEFLTEVTA
jgi:pimeloyl-ACP methyl ester carboxylesterase